tara:strand:- start:58 stop:261 length:204 start_codon:yes stop_codon:yes gene_type:complete
MKLSDEVVGHIAKCLQMAIITGTDIVDHLRQLVLIEKDGEICLNAEFKENAEKNIQKMIDDINTLNN